MNVIKIVPRGFCFGVVKSLEIAKETAKKYKNKNIYMVGMLVHNKIIIDELNDLGIKLIDDFKKSRFEIINSLKEKSVLIFSAHGTNDDVIKIAKKNGHIVIDTICEWVEETRQHILKSLKKNKKVIFIGKNNHPETNALCSIDYKNIFLIENIDDIKKIPYDENENLFCTNQTTLSLIKTNEIYNILKNKYKNLEFKNDICDATTKRQNAIFKLKNENIDLLIVVGDQRSSNTIELVKIGKSLNIKSIRISNIDELNLQILKNIKCVAVTSGTSTSSIVTNNIIQFLENY